ncbi:MAG: 50S ribosomal protein L9 [Deltaproteobacteria bacterium]
MSTKVILKENVPGVGQAGEVKQVKDGFARNFLLPRNLALLASDHALRQVALEKSKRETAAANEKKRAEELAAKLKGVSLTLAVEVNEEDRLYGSLIEHDIVQALAAEGIAIDKKMVLLEEPIKALGIFDIPIKLSPELTVAVKTWVVKK